MDPQDKSIGWWSGGTKVMARDSVREEAKKVCRFTSNGECPYKREQFDCYDCVIEDGGVMPKI